MNIGILRNTILSTASHLDTQLDANGWSGVSVVGELPDENSVVMPSDATGATNEVVIPAIRIEESFSSKGNMMGIGESVQEQAITLFVIIYGESPGQEKALRSFVETALGDYRVPFYDFSNYGYPPVGTPTASGNVIYANVRSRPVHNPGNINAALRYGGIMSVNAIVQRELLTY